MHSPETETLTPCMQSVQIRVVSGSNNPINTCLREICLP